MPGMMKAARRRQKLARQIHEVELPQPFFGSDIVGTAWGSARDGTPVLMFVLGCSPEELAAYAKTLRKVTLHVIKHEPYEALVVVKDGVSLGRLTTSLGSPLALIVDRLEATGGRELQIGLMALGAEPVPPIELEVVIQDEIVDDFEPVEVGQGGFVCFCMNVHTGVAYAHRFATQAEAQEQRRRNEAVDRPFAGLEATAN